MTTNIVQTPQIDSPVLVETIQAYEEALTALNVRYQLIQKVAENTLKKLERLNKTYLPTRQWGWCYQHSNGLPRVSYKYDPIQQQIIIILPSPIPPRNGTEPFRDPLTYTKEHGLLLHLPAEFFTHKHDPINVAQWARHHIKQATIRELNEETKDLQKEIKTTQHAYEQEKQRQQATLTRQKEQLNTIKQKAKKLTGTQK